MIHRDSLFRRYVPIGDRLRAYPHRMVPKRWYITLAGLRIHTMVRASEIRMMMAGSRQEG